MNYKDKYKKYVETNFEPRDDFEKLCNKMEMNTMKNNNKKFVKFGLGFLATAVVIGGVVVGVQAFTKNKDKNTNINKLVTLSLDNGNMTNLATNNTIEDTNITLSVDENNKVYSVYGEDQLAKMVLVDENLVGKDINDALKTIIDIEINTGLIIKGSISGSDNSLELQVSAELSEEAQKYVEELKKTVEQKINDSNIRATISTAKSLVLDEIKNKVKEINPDLDVTNMTYEEMVKTIALHQIDMASLYGEQLEQVYNDIKDYEFDFVDKQATKDIINKLDATYVELKNAYVKAVEALDQAIKGLNKAKYDAIISPTSSFQKAYVELQTKLNDLIIAKNNLDPNDISANIEFAAKKIAFETSLTLLETAKTGVESLCKVAETILLEAKDLLEKIEAKLPDSIKQDITNTLNKEQDKLNELKDNVFDTFEKEHKDDIEKLKLNLKEQKQKLIEGIKKS